MSASTAETIAALEERVNSLTEALKDTTKTTSGFGSAVRQSGNQLEKGLTGFTTGLANGAQGASAFNGAIGSAGAAVSTMLSAIGPLSTAFSKLTDFAVAYIVRANVQGDALFKSFQDLSRVGGASAEGMTGIFNNMQKLGMTMNQLPEFGAMIAQNSEALAMLGGTVTQGAKQFSEVAAGIQQSGLKSEFERMGLNTKNINEGTASYLRLQTLTGASAKKTQEELTAGAAQYIQQQDRLSKLTGKSADALAKEEEARLSDQRYAALTRELEQKAAAARAAGDEAGAKAAEDQIAQNRELMAQTPAALRQGVQDLMSGFVNSPEAKKMYTSLPEMSQAIMSQNYKASEVLSKGATEATGSLDRNTALAKAGLSNQVNADFAGLRDLEAKNRAKTSEENAAAAKEEQNKLKEGADKDINNQVAMRQAQTATTLAMDQLVQKGVGPLTAGMMELAVGIEKVITKIPGVDKKTSVSNPGENRGMNAPATAGYGTNTKPEDFVKFINDTGSALTGAATPREVTTRTQAHQALSRNAPRLADTSRTPVGDTSGVRANNILQKAAADYDTNTQSTTGTGSTTLSSLSDLPQSIMTLANNIGMQATNTKDLVELMRRSLDTQKQILTQSRN